MARCEHCGKTTTFGQSRSFSMRATRRTFRPNLQKVRVMEGGRHVHRTLCAKCINASPRVDRGPGDCARSLRLSAAQAAPRCFLRPGSLDRGPQALQPRADPLPDV
jgi:large subunit ribosomal protein L28